MDPEIREKIKERMFDRLKSTNLANWTEAAKILIDMERISDINTLNQSMGLFRQELESIKSEINALKRG